MNCKIVLLACVLQIFIATANTKSLFSGVREPGDYLLHHENVFVKFKPFMQVELTINFETKYLHRERITSVDLIDQTSFFENGGTGSVMGGPGFDFATINLRSDWFRSIDFNITIYGIPEEGLIDEDFVDYIK